MQCTNNLKQLGLALQNFHDTNNRFPNQGTDAYWVKGFRDFSNPNTHVGGIDIYSVFSLTLPFIEQQPLMTRLTGLCQDASSGKYKKAPLAWRNDKAEDGSENPFCTVVSAFLCPSDGNTSGTSGSGELAPCNYAASRGDWVVGFNWAHNAQKKRGVFYDVARGGGNTTLAAITDGTSNTMLFSELTASSRGGDKRYLTALADAKIQSANGAAICAATRGTDGMTNSSFQFTEKGRRWGDARGPFHNFHAALPPNSPSCYQSTDGAGSMNEYSSCMCVSASSYHSGGVNVVMCDGSVRFVSETVDCGDIQHALGYPQNNDGDWAWSGKSTRGVWGAMATPQSGETVSP